MKHLGKVFVAVCWIVLCSSLALSQNLVEEFNYGVSDNADITLVATGWVRHSGAQGPTYVAAGLSYAGYPSSGVGGCIGFTHGSSGVNDGDVNKQFVTDITTDNSVYLSFLINVSSAQATDDYFVHLGPQTIGTTFRGRVHARSNGAGWSLGLSKSSEAATLDATVLNYGQTYLIVMKYAFSTVATTDDLVTLYLYSSGVPSTEPGTPDLTIGPVGATVISDPADIGCVAIRQGGNSPAAQVDGIRVATSWNLSPLPVEMTSFTASANRLSAQLHWSTATEVNNFGFEIERKSGTTSWSKVGFVAGAGTSTSLHTYTFSDNLEQAGMYEYRIKQIDKNGASKYSPSTQVVVGSAAKVLSLGANFPNPFNPSTNMEFTVPSDGRVVLKVYNIVGQEVATLFEGNAVAGQINKASFNASRLPSGVYFSRMEFGGNVLVKRMMLLK